MSPRAALATSYRVLLQLRHDPRTIALMLVVPAALLSLLWWMYEGGPVFDQAGPALLAIFPFTIMFLITSIATLRERTSGTLERLLTMPIGKLDLLLGYALAFGILAAAQAAIVVTIAIGPLSLDMEGPIVLVVLVAVLDAVLGMSLGLFASAFAVSEFQVVQFMPAFVLPQFLLCGLFIAREDLPGVLEGVSNVLPMSYAVEAMTEVQHNAAPELWGYVAIILAFTIGLLALGAATLRRRTR